MADTNEQNKDQQNAQNGDAQKEAKTAAADQTAAGKQDTAGKQDEKPAPKTELELAKDKIEALEKQVEELTKDRDSY